MTTRDVTYLETTFLEELDLRFNRPPALHPTGLCEYDNLLHGGYVEGLHILGGLPGVGKTSFALALAAHSAQAKKHVVYLTLEQPKSELWARIAGAHTEFSPADFKRGTIRGDEGKNESLANRLRAADEWADIVRLSHYMTIVEGGDGLSATGYGSDVDLLANLAERVTTESGTPPLVILDYLQRMPAQESPSRDPRERIGRAVGLLQLRLARGLGATVLALSSLNRASYNAGSRGYRDQPEDGLASLKEAGEIEYTGSTVTLLRATGASPAGAANLKRTQPATRQMELALRKHRDGDTGMARVTWDPASNNWNPEQRPSAFEMRVRDL